MDFVTSDVAVDVIGFGALNVDKLHSVDFIASEDQETFIRDVCETPGGSAANTIIGLSKLNHPVSVIGKIAEDNEGDLIEINLALNKVYTNNLIYADKGSTGKTLGFVDKDGERCLYVDSGVNDEISIDEINPLFIYKCKIMHYTSFVANSINAQIELLDKLNEETLLSFDPGLLYAKLGLDVLKPILDRTNILLINQSEFNLLFDDLSVDDVIARGIETVVIKQGSSGVYAKNLKEECFVESFKTEVVDTTGAGDSFNSGFLHGVLNGYSLEKSCLIGNWVASQSIKNFGMDSFPTLNELNKFLKVKS